MDCDPDSKYHIRNSMIYLGLFAVPFTLSTK